MRSNYWRGMQTMESTSYHTYEYRRRPAGSIVYGRSHRMDDRGFQLETHQWWELHWQQKVAQTVLNTF